MKTNKFTLALAAMGLISLASAAQAQTIIYLTGSTAARQYVYNALHHARSGVHRRTNDTISRSGNPAVTTYSPLKAMFPALAIRSTIAPSTGSEAGVAAVAGQPLTQTLPNDPNGTPGTTAWALPGTPQPSYLTGASVGVMTGASRPRVGSLHGGYLPSSLPHPGLVVSPASVRHCWRDYIHLHERL